MGAWNGYSVRRAAHGIIGQATDKLRTLAAKADDPSTCPLRTVRHMNRKFSVGRPRLGLCNWSRGRTQSVLGAEDSESK